MLGGEGGGVGGRRGRGVEDVKRLDGAVEEVGGEAVYRRLGERRGHGADHEHGAGSVGGEDDIQELVE